MAFRRTTAVLATAILAATLTPASIAAAVPEQPPDSVRFAQFNASLNRSEEGQLISDLSTPDNAQAGNVAEIIQRTRPDVLLINEFDYDAGGQALTLFQDNYLSVPHNGAAPIDYPFSFAAPSNTGIQSGFDLNNDGVIGGPDDAFGFGFFPGQFGMAVYSKYPIDADAVRTFQLFLWKDMPGALLPDDPATPEPGDFYSEEELAVFRLSSKSHWDLPVRIGQRTVHFLVSHPTPPVFDGPEDRNGRRNHDEIRFWADYISPLKARYIYDDEGGRGGLPRGADFVIAGDQNSDPRDGDSIPGAIQQILDHRRVNDSMTPGSLGAVEATLRQRGANLSHRSNPRFDTADFNDNPSPGNLRADYVLPSTGLAILDSAVFWPVSANPLSRLTGQFDPSLPGGFPSSDHRLVWVDVTTSGA
ncbi:endonuclease/exonuclease/phosphatase family protein [soil metagenome]